MKFEYYYKNFLKILKKVLKGSNSFISLFLKIIATLATILLTIQANQILKQQNIINQIEIERNAMEVAPSFTFSKKEQEDYTFYKMTNSKGFISNVFFEKIDRIIFDSYSREGTPFKVIMELPTFNIPVEDDLESWTVKIDQKINLHHFSMEVVKKVNDYLNSNDFSYISYSYYHVAYNDYQNIRHEEYYETDWRGTGIYTDSYSNVKDNIHNGIYHLFHTEKEYLLMDQIDYSKLSDIAASEILKYYHK